MCLEFLHLHLLIICVLIFLLSVYYILVQGRGVYKVLVRKPVGKRPLGRLRRRWDDNIKMDLQKVGGGCEDWMKLA